MLGLWGRRHCSQPGPEAQLSTAPPATKPPPGRSRAKCAGSAEVCPNSTGKSGQLCQLSAGRPLVLWENQLGDRPHSPRSQLVVWDQVHVTGPSGSNNDLNPVQVEIHIFGTNKRSYSLLDSRRGSFYLGLPPKRMIVRSSQRAWFIQLTQLQNAAS